MSKANRKPARKSTSTPAKKAKVFPDKPRPAVAPDKVLIALLGWWDAITDEIGRMSGMMNEFRVNTGGEFHPGFEFASEAAYGLMSIQEALDDARPSLPAWTIGEVRKLIANDDPPG